VISGEALASAAPDAEAAAEGDALDDEQALKTRANDARRTPMRPIRCPMWLLRV